MTEKNKLQSFLTVLPFYLGMSDAFLIAYETFQALQKNSPASIVSRLV